MTNITNLDTLQVQLTKIDNLQRSDHDTSVRVETKMDNLLIDVKTLSDGFAVKMLDHETRLRKIEDMLTQSNPVINKGRIDVLEGQYHDQKTTANVYRVVAGLVGGGVMFALTQIPNWLRLSGIFK